MLLDPDYRDKPGWWTLQRRLLLAAAITATVAAPVANAGHPIHMKPGGIDVYHPQAR